MAASGTRTRRRGPDPNEAPVWPDFLVKLTQNDRFSIDACHAIPVFCGERVTYFQDMKPYGPKKIGVKDVSSAEAWSRHRPRPE